MKSTIIIAGLFVAFISLFSTVQSETSFDDSSGIDFVEGTWQEALDLAKTENKLIFLDAYASWCGPCKQMQKYVFSTPEAGKFFNERFINVKVDMEKGEGRELASKYAVRAYPSLFFIDHNGKVKKSAVGYQNTDQLIKLGYKALK